MEGMRGLQATALRVRATAARAARAKVDQVELLVAAGESANGAVEKEVKMEARMEARMGVEMEAVMEAVAAAGRVVVADRAGVLVPKVVCLARQLGRWCEAHRHQ